MSRFLYDAIHNLSAREKAYFKRFSQLHGKRNDKSYMQLFEALLEMPEYNFAELKTQFAESSFANRITAQLAYLNEQLLKSLANYYLDSSPNFTLQKSILFIEILNKKGHKKQSQRLLARAKKTAYDIEDFTTILKLIQLEEEVLFNQGVLKFTKQLEKLKRERNQLYESINNINELRLLIEQIRDLFYVNVFDIDTHEYDDIFNHRLLINPSEKLCITAKQLWHYAVMWKHFINLEFDKALKTTIACLNHMNQYTLIFPRKKTLPIISNLLMLSALCKKEKIFKENYKRLSQAEFNQPDVKIYLEYIKIVRLLEWTYQTSDTKGTIKAISEYTEWILLNYKRMEVIQSNHCLLLIVRAFIDIGQFNEALDWHNHLIANGIQNFTLIHTKIISLIIHLEFGWLEILETEIESVKKTLKRHNKYYLFVQTFISFVKKVLKNPSMELLYLKQLRQQLNSMKSQTQHNRIFIYLNYERWCEQRLHRILSPEK